MEKKVWAFINEHNMIREGQKVGAATSGGPDSMALLVCLCGLAAKHGFSVVCIHFEHGIRGEQSLADAEFVAGYCEEHRIPLYVGAADVPALAEEWGVSTETAAKRAREEYFYSLIDGEEVDVIATAHHSDDNAESILMHILRGSGLAGLVGIAPEKQGIIRPMLNVTRQEVIQYLRYKEVPCVVDETNADNSYRRNYVRNVLLPEIGQKINSDVSAALNRLGKLAESDEEYLEQQAQEAFGQGAAVCGDCVKIDAGKLNALHPAIVRRVIREGCKRLHVTSDVEMAHVEAVLRLAKADHTGKQTDLAANLTARMEYGTLILGFAGREKNYSFEQRFDPMDRNVMPDGGVIECEMLKKADMPDRYNDDPYVECLDADKLPECTLRTRHDGDVIKLLGCGGSKKLKDYFIDKKLTREERAVTPLLADGKQIIWVLGHVISQDYCVDADTKNVLRLTYKRGKR